MQRLEVSGSVQPLYSSLGVKGLMIKSLSIHVASINIKGLRTRYGVSSGGGVG